MEEVVGQIWDRWITRAADRAYPQAAVHLADMRKAIAMLFHAGGGPASTRLAEAGLSRHGGARTWLQRVAGSGERAALPVLDAQSLALPPVLAVFDDAALNRELYLWLAALSAAMSRTDPSGQAWLVANHAATQRVLADWPGLAARYPRLLAAQLAQRPDPAGLTREQARCEAAVRTVLLGHRPAADWADIAAHDVAPVWLWLSVQASPDGAPAMQRPQDAAPAPDGSSSKQAAADRRRRRAKRVEDDTRRNGLLMIFRAESLLSWSEHVRVNRMGDDEDDGNAQRAADDMAQLAVTEGGQTLASRVRFDLDLPSAASDDLPLGPGMPLPEWDWRRAALLPDHCRVQLLAAPALPGYEPPAALRATAQRVRRRLEVLRAKPRALRGEPSGEEIDIDAWVRVQSEDNPAARSSEPRVYTRLVRTERSLATLLLADLSLSTDAWATQQARVIDLIRDALFVFGEALSASGDAFEMLGFSSVRRQNVRVHQLKGFDENWSRGVRERLGAIKPGYYTRMGAALRHATQRLQARPERQRLLLILTDGKPNDLDVYEGRYGLEDTRHAVQQARQAGLVPFCVTIDHEAHDYLPMLFGARGWALVHRPAELVQRLTQVHAALTR